MGIEIKNRKASLSNTQSPDVPPQGLTSGSVEEATGMTTPNIDFNDRSSFKIMGVDDKTVVPATGVTADFNFTKEREESNPFSEGVDTYNRAFERYARQYKVGYDVEGQYTSDIRKKALDVSPYYRKYGDSDYITFNSQDWNAIAAKYNAILDAYGESDANQYLQSTIVDEVAKNQGFGSKLWNTIAGGGTTVAGDIVSTVGMLAGAVGVADYERDENLSDWQNFWNRVIDNSWTRYGGDIVKYGTVLNMDRARDYGLSESEIINDSKQARQLVSWNTPFEVVQQGGFTLASMFVGGALSKSANVAFKLGKKGAMATAKNAASARKAVKAWRTAEKINNAVIIPGLVGTTEGAIEGLETKRNIQEKGYQNAYDTHSKMIQEGFSEDMHKAGYTLGTFGWEKDGQVLDRDLVESWYAEYWRKNQSKLDEAFAEVDAEATKAGIRNFGINSLINGMLGATLKAGIQAPAVRNQLRNSRLFGPKVKPKFNVTGGTGEYNVTVKSPAFAKAWFMAKEPLGEFAEEFSQSLSNDFTTGFAAYNIDHFLQHKYNGDGIGTIGEEFSGSMGAAWAALGESLENRETWKSGIYGALSSVVGTAAGMHRTNKIGADGKPVYKRDSNGKILKDKNGNPIVEKTLFGRGLNTEGERESGWEVAQRVMPWRSGLFANYREYEQQLKESQKTALALQEWLNDSKNYAKFKGLGGTASWTAEMNESASIGDEFSYRNTVLGKTINDVYMLEQLKGTEFYDNIMEQLATIANMERSSEIAQSYIKAMKENINTSDEKISDDEIFTSLQKNARLMQETMDKINTESENLERLLGDIDEDAKQSLIYGQLSVEDWQKRKQQLLTELGNIKIDNSVESSGLNDAQKKNILLAAKKGRLNSEITKTVNKVSELESSIEQLEKKRKLNDSERTLLENKKADLAQTKAYKDELWKLQEEISQTDGKILNEQELMALDPVTRARVFREANKELYASLHGKQLTEEEKKKAKSPFSPEQQAVIDRLVQQGMAQDKNFLDKIIDAGRLTESIDKFMKQSADIMTNQESYQMYVKQAKRDAADYLSKETAQDLNKIEDYDKFVEAFNTAIETASPRGIGIIVKELKNNANFKRWTEEQNSISSLMEATANMEKYGKLDGNSASLNDYFIKYLSDNRVDLNDMDKVWEALNATNEKGYNKFAAFLENEMADIAPENRIKFTSIEDIYQAYKDAHQVAKTTQELEEKRNAQKTVKPEQQQETPNPNPTPAAQEAPKAEPAIPEVKPTETVGEAGALIQVAKWTIENEGRRHNYAEEDVKKALSLLDDAMGQETLEDFEDVVDRTRRQENNAVQSLVKIGLQGMKDRQQLMKAAVIHTIDITKEREKHPEGWAATFYDAHNIETFLSDASINGDTEIYFLTDDKATNDVKTSIEAVGGIYNQGMLPIIIAVKSNKGDYEIDGVKYQPIGILPRSNSWSYNGSSRLDNIRKLAANNQGISLIYYNGKPLTTRTDGLGGGITAKVIRGTKTNSIHIVINNDLHTSQRKDYEGKSRTEIRKTSGYQAIKNKILKHLAVQPDPTTGYPQLAYMQPTMKDDDTNPLYMWEKDYEETTARDSDMTLLDAAIQGLGDNPQAIITFNSRTKRAADAVKDLLEKMPSTKEATTSTISDIAALAKPLEEAIDRFIKLRPGNNYSYVIRPLAGEENIINGERKFSLELVSDSGAPIIQLAEFTKDSNPERVAADVLGHLFADGGSLRMSNGKTLTKWQVDYGEVEKMHNGDARAKANLADLIDDNLLKLKQESFNYAIGSVRIQDPFINNGELRFKPKEQTLNSNDGGQVVGVSQTTDGTTVDSDSGMTVGDKQPKASNPILDRAKELVNVITEDSKNYELTEDGKFYKDKVTGKLYSRVTTVIQSDERGSHMDENNPWTLPSTNIGTTVDEFIRDFFAGTLKESYPNATKQQWESFKQQLEQWQNQMLAQGYTIVPRDVTVTGSVRLTDSQGRTYDMNVAGTLDLLVYDTKGNFYIVDIKTVRSDESVLNNKTKWSQQTTLYQKFLEQKYGIKVVDRIILPIKVEYPAPSKGKYSQGEGTQLLSNGKPFTEAKPTMMKTVQMPEANFNLNYDNLSESDKDLATEIQTSAEQGNTSEAEAVQDIKTATVESNTYVDPETGYLTDNLDMEDMFGIPVEPVGAEETPTVNSWNQLTEEEKQNAIKAGYTEESFNASSPEEQERAKNCLS